ncbi:YxeA family protein [Brevibacterium sp. JNUCC-42]|nr:YxeA family protein [Brevibacterium sp. JNUCC-42]
MKKNLGFIISLLIGSVALAGCEQDQYNVLGNETEFYAAMLSEGKELTNQGKEYTLPTYDKDGNKKILTYTTDSKLPEGSLVKFTINHQGDVTNLDNVFIKDIPAPAQQQLHIQ